MSGHHNLALPSRGPARVISRVPALAFLVLALTSMGGLTVANAAPTGTAVASGKWSDPATWGGSVPAANAEVSIPAGRAVVLDTSPPALSGLKVDGALTFADADIRLSVGYIKVKGALNIGSFGVPFSRQAVITLTGQADYPDAASARGITVEGGELNLFGLVPWPIWTKLNDHAASGATTLQLDQATNWRIGDNVVVAPTTFYGQSETERLVLTGASGAILTTSAGLRAARWGKMQYMTNAGLSLTSDPNYLPPKTPASTVLDERAAVGNLSRRIVIEGADDGLWATQGFGAHVEIAGTASRVAINGVELRRVGQAGKYGQYPIHWRMLSYDPATGKELGDAAGHVIQNSAIWNSANRCVVIQGTNGVAVKNNVCYDIKGHAFMLEDGSERRNVFDGNLALKTRTAAAAAILKAHEMQGYQIGPSGFWISNPDNTVVKNLGADAQGNGLWLSFPFKPLGLSRRVPIYPRNIPLLKVESNTVHTARGPGILLEWVQVDDAVPNPEATKGRIVGQKFVPIEGGAACLTATGEAYDWCKGRLRFTIKATTSFKNLDGAYRNRVSNPDYLEWTVADNVGMAFAGAADDGNIERALVVGYSLNHTDSTYPTGALPPAGLATYHSSVDMQYNVFVNLPLVDGVTSGAFSAEDYYLNGVEKGPVRNQGNRLIASAPGYRNLQPGLSAVHNPAENWALSGAILDAEGIFGPRGWYTVPSTSFLTYGAKCTDALPAGRNGKTCEGEYFGVGAFQTDFDTSRFAFGAAIDVRRLDPSSNLVGTWRIEDGYGTYRNSAVASAYACSTKVTPPAGNFCSWKLGQMRHFAARQDARYVLSFPGRPSPKWVAMNVTNAYRAGDAFLLAVAFDGRLTASGYEVAGAQYQRESAMFNAAARSQPNFRAFRSVGSFSEVAASDGWTMWQDRANNLVWFKHRGGLTYPNESTLEVNSGDYLYRPYSVVVYAQAECAAARDLNGCFTLLQSLK